MNIYTKPLAASSTQTVLPAMLEDGRVVGWYPITETEFDGTEVAFTLDDNVEVPLKVVTVDSATAVTQYVAAVWPTGLANNYQPWASSQLVSVADGNFRIWNMTTQGSKVREGGGILVEAFRSNMAPSILNTTPNLNPQVADMVSLAWNASVKYDLLTGNCTFFDFNWMTLVSNTLVDGEQAFRLEVVSNPAPIGVEKQSPLLARVLGVPTALGDGVVYDTVRIMKNRDTIPAGAYVFQFKVYNTQGYSTAVALTVTVA